ncbi:unnamed protein product, partial [Prorocentrum cordatum]
EPAAPAAAAPPGGAFSAPPASGFSAPPASDAPPRAADAYSGSDYSKYSSSIYEREGHRDVMLAHGRRDTETAGPTRSRRAPGSASTASSSGRRWVLPWGAASAC